MTKKKVTSGHEVKSRGRRRALLGVAGALLAPRAPAQPIRSTSSPPSRHPHPVASSSSLSTRHPHPVTPFAEVRRGHTLRFPEDHGSHPAFRTEWWYITGWLQAAARAPIGFQVTFFRAKPEVDGRNPSSFAPREIIIAHAALSEAARGHLLHDQTVARAALGLAGAEERQLRVWVDDWWLGTDAGRYRARVPAREFALDLAFRPTQPPLLQGDGGFSRKGPKPQSASYYYSLPHLDVTGEVVQRGRQTRVTGRAWLDHEWSSSYMDERATGWDWIGINLDDGGSLMAFRMRDAHNAQFWAGGAHRAPDGARRAFESRDIEFTPLRTWRSGRTGATYPVAWRVRAGALDITIEPLMEDQENDTRASVGTIYWEGAVHALRDGKPIGRGYLELTGYWRRMKV